MLRRLTAAGARAVVFDIVFGATGPSVVADNAFADAIRDNGRVILAAEYNNYSVAPNDDHAWVRLGTIEPLHEPFVRNAAAWGIASQGIDDDNVVRRYVTGFTTAPQPSPVRSFCRSSRTA